MKSKNIVVAIGEDRSGMSYTSLWLTETLCRSWGGEVPASVDFLSDMQQEMKTPFIIRDEVSS